MPSPEPTPRTEAALSATDRRLLDLAYASVTHAARAGRPLPVSLEHEPTALRELGASFVTLRHGRDLRGCTGMVQAIRPLAVDVAENAAAAALRDPRFPALRPEELPGLSVSVSVLSPMEPFPVASEAELLAKVRPGVDGLMLTEGPRRGLFLPAVWEEVPDPATFLAHLRRKAGLPAGWWSPSLQVHRFTVRKIAGPPPASWPAP